jgi:hypothetical protein
MMIIGCEFHTRIAVPSHLSPFAQLHPRNVVALAILRLKLLPRSKMGIGLRTPKSPQHAGP